MAMAMAVALVAVSATDASRQQEFKSDDNNETSIRTKRAMGILSTSRPHPRLYSSGSRARVGGHLQWAGHPLNLTKTITHRSVQSLISEVVLDHGMLTVKTSPHHCLIQPPLLERAFST